MVNSAIVILLPLMLGALSAEAAGPFRQVLTSAARGVHLDRWSMRSDDLGGHWKAPWSIEKITLHGGKQEGVDLIRIRNEALQLTVIPTRGMGLLEARLGRIRFGWDSPVREVVHPAYIDLEGRGGLGWLEGFNEWIARCGLEYAGHPGPDRFINNVGQQAEMNLTLHGRIENIPASEVEVIVEPGDPGRIRIRGRVDETMFYGPNLELWTEVATPIGSDAIQIRDELTNRGAFDQEFELLYHCNFGPPLLEEGSRFVGAAERVVPFNDRAAEGIDSYSVFGPPTPGFVEQVYCLFPRADAGGWSRVMLRNASGDIGVALAFPAKEMPCFTLWKNTTALAAGYVAGLEPGTDFAYNRRIERSQGRLQKIKPSERREFAIDISLLANPDAVARAAAEIGGVQGSSGAALEKTPLAKE